MSCLEDLEDRRHKSNYVRNVVHPGLIYEEEYQK